MPCRNVYEMHQCSVVVAVPLAVAVVVVVVDSCGRELVNACAAVTSSRFVFRADCAGSSICSSEPPTHVFLDVVRRDQAGPMTSIQHQSQFFDFGDC
jgi:hypothetical protein